jgi:hypothetical protein
MAVPSGSSVTLKENLPWVRSFDTMEELNQALLKSPYGGLEVVDALLSSELVEKRTDASPEPVACAFKAISIGFMSGE